MNTYTPPGYASDDGALAARIKDWKQHGAVAAAYLALKGLDPNSQASIGGGVMALIANTLGDATASWLLSGKPIYRGVTVCELSKILSGIYQAFFAALLSKGRMNVTYAAFREGVVTSVTAAFIIEEAYYMGVADRPGASGASSPAGDATAP